MSARTIAMVLGTIAGSYAILIGGIFFMVGRLHHGEAVRYSHYTAQQTKVTPVPLPHLDVHPLEIYDAYHTRQLHRLGHYHQIGGGYARIPIDRAMQIERGKSLNPGNGAAPASAPARPRQS